MGNVSTRTQKAATPVAKAATPFTASTTDKLSSQPENEKRVDPYTAILNAHGCAGLLADRVCSDEESETRRRIAFDANYSIQELAKALRDYHMRTSTDDWPVYYGMLGQIQQLSEIVWCAMRLGGNDESMTYPSNETLQQFMDGHFTLIARHEA